MEQLERPVFYFFLKTNRKKITIKAEETAKLL